MLHDNIYIYRLTVHAQQEEKSRIIDSKTQDLFIIVLQRVGLISNKILGSKKGFLIKFSPSSLRLVMKGCLNLSLKKEGVLTHQTRIQLVKSVARSILVNALREIIIVFVVSRVVTRFWISLM